jgi:DNA mismatch repair protein PMS2
VKELLENAMDAGATRIEVRFVNHGMQLIEVVDNGSGILDEDLQTVTERYTTSKLQTFHDLSSVSTFGFRGEALNSLCHVASVSITTRHATRSLGVTVHYDQLGKIRTKQAVARDFGTTVAAKSMFEALPVRRKELERNAKREYTKCISMLQNYAIIACGIRISVWHNSKLVFATEGKSRIQDQWASLFGSKEALQLQECNATISLPSSTASTSETAATDDKDNKEPSIVGVYALGVAAAERQFLFCNGRPIQHPKFTKLIKDVVKGKTSAQKSIGIFYALDFRCPPDFVDVNVTPDKRTVYITAEAAILEALRSLMDSAMDHHFSTFSVGQVESMSVRPPSPKRVKRESDSDPLSSLSVSSPPFANPEASSSASSHTSPESLLNPNPVSRPRSVSPAATTLTASRKEYLDRSAVDGEDEDETSDLPMDMPDPLRTSVKPSAFVRRPPSQGNPFDRFRKDAGLVPTATIASLSQPSVKDYFVPARCPDKAAAVVDQEVALPEVPRSPPKEERPATVPNRTNSPILASEEAPGSSIVPDESSTSPAIRFQPRQLAVEFDVAEMRRIMSNSANDDADGSADEDEEMLSVSRKASDQTIRVAATDVTDPDMRVQISKSDFARMRIIGQFNLGFILVELDGHLLIVDQHASDEIFNFHRYCDSMEIRTQRLLRPVKLEIDCADAEIIREPQHLATLKRCGFLVQEDENANWWVHELPFFGPRLLGVSDLYELIARIRDDPSNPSQQPSTVRSVLASRACRTSIMIGDPLDMSTMRRVVQHLGEIDKPWNCPHGRPTMRHLCDLDSVQLVHNTEVD